SGKEAKVTVQPSHGLTNEEVEQLVLDSIEHAREDFNARRFIELKNKAEADLRHTDKALAMEGVVLAPEERQRIEAAQARARAAIQGGNGDRLQEALDELNAATQGLATQLMNAAARAALKDRKMEEVNPNKL